MKLNYETELAFMEMIDNSIVERYDGPLERLGPDKHSDIPYRPLDTDHVRNLLTSLWGDPALSRSNQGRL